MRFRTIIILMLLPVFSFNFSIAQNFGGTPASVKWKQINTDTIRIIFPEGLDTVATRIASITHYIERNYSNTIGRRIRKINLVLQDNTTISNAYVALGVWRSEFYLMPPQNAFALGAQNWADNLAIHEFRHVEQYSNYNVGLSKKMSILFGQNGQALANAAAVPNWFFEGDAVYNETMLSHQGRGRLAAFFNDYKSLYYAGKHYSYMQLRNGSYKNYIPDHYSLGYLLVAFGREKYGNDFWRKVTTDAAAFRPLFYPLQGAVKKYASISFTEFTNDAMQFFKRQWENDTLSRIRFITPTQKNNVIDYKYPYRIDGGSLIVLKRSFRDIPAFYLVHPGGRGGSNEAKIAARDIGYDDYFSYNNHKIVYAAYEPDLRWGNRDFSVIKILDISNGEEKKISVHTKYFSPDISHDGKLIAAVRMHPDLSSDIVLLDENGMVKKIFNNHRSIIYSYPKFSDGDQFLCVIIRNNAGEMGIERININDNSVTELVPLKNRIIGFPVVKGDTLLYSCSNRGRDEIWAYTETQHQNYRIASCRTGLYQAAFSNDTSIVSSTFTADGYRLVSANPLWQPVSNDDTLTGLYVSGPFQPKDNNVLEHIPSSSFISTKYNKAYNIFNFHSWNPYFEQPDYSFFIYGENVLNTFQSRLYYTYNSNEGYSKIGYTGIYGGWYLQPVFDVNETFNRNTSINADTTAYWNELIAAVGLQLPLNLSAGKTYRNISFLATYNYDNVQWTGIAKQLGRNLNFNYLQGRVTYTEQSQKAMQQIYPRWGQAYTMQYRSIITKYTGRQFLAEAAWYIPGFLKTHSIVLSAAYQSRDTVGQYFFTNNFPFSRGYNAIDFPRVWKLGINYHFPVFYPDEGFGNIIFVNRFRANVFYDYTEGKSLRTGIQYHFRTAGIEFYLDTRWWNQQPLSFGLRYSRLLDNSSAGLAPNMWEIILPVSIF